MAEAMNCRQCGVKPGERHDGCDIAKCAATGVQYIQCGGELHTHNGREYGEHEGECKPSIWTGEWPGVAECRALGWYARFMPGTGWERVTAEEAGRYPVGVSEDLNRLAVEGTWNPSTERMEVSS